MKTLTTTILQNRELSKSAGSNLVPSLTSSINEVLALVAAVTVAAAIVLLSVWVSGQEINEVLGAGIWGVGFIFLGIAVDNRDPGAFLQLMTGLALLVLAWLQTSVSSDYAVASGVLVAAWVAIGVYKRLR